MVKEGISSADGHFSAMMVKILSNARFEPVCVRTRTGRPKTRKNWLDKTEHTPLRM